MDFLGNPMGLLNDVSEGVTGLIKYGNVGGLIRNVTHGVSNSAAKVRKWGNSVLVNPVSPLRPCNFLDLSWAVRSYARGLGFIAHVRCLSSLTSDNLAPATEGALGGLLFLPAITTAFHQAWLSLLQATAVAP